MDENPIITKKKVELLQGIFSGLSSSVIIKVLHHPDVAGNMELAGEKLGELLEENPTEGGFVVSDNNKPEKKEAGWERKDDGFNNRYFKIGTEVINHDIEDKDVANYAEQKWGVSREDETEVVPTAKQKHLKQGPKNKQKSTFHRKKEGKREDTGEECISSQSTLPDVPIQRSSRDLSQKQSEKILSSTNSREQYPKNENQEVKSSLSDQTQASLQNIAGNPSSRSRNRRRRNKQSKMERNLKDSDNKCTQGISSSERLAVGFNPTPKEGHLGDDGNEKDCKLYEPKLILVTGMRDTTSQDALSNYMELMASDDVEKVTFLGKGRAVVDLRNDPDFEKLKEKVRGRKLEGMHLNVERIYACDSILVNRIPPEVTKDTIASYFENVRQSGGGDVRAVILCKDKRLAVVTFTNFKVVSNVIAKEHFLENEELTVKKYYPQLEGQVINELLCEIPLSSKKKAEVEGELSKPVNLVKPAILPGRQTISVDVDHDIMEFTTNGTYFKELENKLCDLKAEVEWDFGSDIATIRKKANSGYVKKWASSCQAVMVEYLDRFEKFFVPLDEKVEATVNATLPRLAEMVSSKKATWKQVETEQKLMVVCSKDDLENVTQSVKEFMETIKKEEIRKSYKKETIRGINQYRLQLLKQSRFAKKMEDKHAELDVKLDLEKQELSFEGPREQFTDAKIRYLHTMNEISEETLVLSPHNVVDILASEEGKSYIQEKLAREKIAAIFLTEDGNVIRIFAENSRELGRARDCIRNSMSKAQIPFPEGHTFAFIKEKWKQLSERLKSHRLIDLSINYSTSSIALYGAADIVEESKVSITEYLASQTIQERKRVVSHGVARFLSQNLSSKVKNIELELKDDQASIEINKTQNVIWFKATKSGLDKCERSVAELCQMVSVKRNELSSPGLSRLLSSETGQRYMKLIEIEKNLIIEVTREQRKGAIVDTSKIEVESIRKKIEREREKKISFEENRRKSVINTKSVESTYDLCNFSTKEGIRVSWKYGNIANETADILVNSAHSDLNNPTACSKALSKVGGPSFIQECREYKNINKGGVVRTCGGDLACGFVLHAVCCSWDDYQGKSDKVLRHLVKQILCQCFCCCATSLAMPAIGTGQHMFPDDVVFRILREEIEYFSTCLPSFCLKEIRIIIFAKQPITKRTPGPRRPPPFSIRPPPSYSAIPSSRTMSFWPVCVSLLEGDITQHPVDAIINVLPNDLQLSKGGSVCKKILETGGQTVQDQLNTIGKRSRGFIVRTTAGSMRNAQTLLHFVPSATDAPSLQCSIAACLNEVKALSLASVSISAIGTGPFRITARNSAEIILKAVKNFSTLYYPLDVNVIVFQRNMIQDFETVMQAMAPQSGINRENARHSSNEAQSCGTSPSQSSTVSYFKPLSTGEPKQVLKLDFIGCSNQDIDASIDEVNKFVKGHTKTKEIEHENVFYVLVDQWSNVEKLAHDQDVKITCRAPAAVCIEGLVTNVSESKEELSRLINAFVEKERKINQRKYISRNVQWYCFQGGQPVKYDEDQNELIETAFMENREIVHISKFGDQYEIDLTLMTEKSQKNGHVGRITRKRLGESDSDISLPEHWDPQPLGQVVHLVSLSPSSSEYQQVLNHFTSKGGTSRQIMKIERIQNPGLYKAYLVKKQSMNGADNEMQLFHGTSSNNTQSINANNFSRSYAGINGVKYGNGVYFARDASYSLAYSQRESSGYCQMYVARVLVGKFTIGAAGMKAPPSRNDPTNPGLLYDSVVNRIPRPSIFVIFVDHQCYPEYLITFTQEVISSPT